ncbi:MAG TPA: hypothetical protein VIO95_17120, partial [Mycobacterium sp.]
MAEIVGHGEETSSNACRSPASRNGNGSPAAQPAGSDPLGESACRRHRHDRRKRTVAIAEYDNRQDHHQYLRVHRGRFNQAQTRAETVTNGERITNGKLVTDADARADTDPHADYLPDAVSNCIAHTNTDCSAHTGSHTGSHTSPHACADSDPRTGDRVRATEWQPA